MAGMTGKPFQFTLRQLLLAMTALSVVCGAVLLAVSIFTPVSKVDRLANPVSVAGWDAAGFILHDGRNVSLPGISGLPKNSPALSEVSKRGIEIAADGRIYGLVKIHHWCGNDPVQIHIARVDVSDWLAFLRVGEVIETKLEDFEFDREPGGRITQSGWEIGEYHRFRLWADCVREAKFAK
jgi:hypothetical protein